MKVDVRRWYWENNERSVPHVEKEQSGYAFCGVKIPRYAETIELERKSKEICGRCRRSEGKWGTPGD